MKATFILFLLLNQVVRSYDLETGIGILSTLDRQKSSFVPEGLTYLELCSVMERFEIELLFKRIAFVYHTVLF